MTVYLMSVNKRGPNQLEANIIQNHQLLCPNVHAVWNLVVFDPVLAYSNFLHDIQNIYSIAQLWEMYFEL